MRTYADRFWLRSYGPEVPGRLTYDDATISDLLARTVAVHRRRPALDFFGRTTSYGAFARQVEVLAGGLARLGVRAGDAVAIMLPSCPQHLVAFYAVLHLGATVVEHNPLYTEAELDAPFRDHRAEVAIVWDKAVPVVERLAQHGAPVRHIVSVDLTTAMPATKRAALRLPLPAARKARAALTAPNRGTISWADLASGRPAPRHTVSPDQAALLLYTSGTTGEPKGVPLTHRNLVANVRMGRAWVPGIVEGEEVFLSSLPMFHAYGVTMCVLFGVHVGARLVLLPAPEIPLLIDAFKRITPTFVPAVPPIYARILDETERRGVSIKGVRHSFSGAMSLPPDLVRRWEEATGGLLVEGYGLTEASPIVVGNPMTTRRRPGSIGVPFPDTEVRVVDPDDPDVEVPIGERGELIVRGPQVFHGYKDQPDETAQTFHRDWLRTGDIVRMDADGYLTIVDRIKEMVVTGGFNVYPTEVEHVLRSHPSIEDVAVVGASHPDGGEEVAAIVVLADGHSLDEATLRAHAKESLTPYKVPRRWHKVDELPRNPMGKILRRQAARLLDHHG
ncbi:long-chain-fatty-acid--CoA ligase [Janibacter sp. GXQ6167]|uniref:long-chain-fatty-acid--CoA ligase n=1 Tax=Janibacter sp. GXQ6167 TaxID=3240791 RepID=UPI0035260596